MGEAIIPPELFGFDPDEIWPFTPAVANVIPEDRRPIFLLRSMSASLWDALESSETKAWAAARKAAPEAADTIRRIARIPEADRTDDDAKAYSSALLAWQEAWVEESEKHDRMGLERKVFASCVTGWKNFTTKSGREIPFPADPQRIADCIPGALRAAILSALRAGAVVSDEEKASLT